MKQNNTTYNSSLLRYLERGARLLHEMYHIADSVNATIATDPTQVPYADGYLAGKQAGLQLGIIWLEGAIQLVSLRESGSEVNKG